MLTVVVFVYWPEEENYLTACLETVKWAEEIVVVDNGATLRTLTVARKYTTKIFRDRGSDFAARHNLGKEKASGDWVIYVDADERISQALQREIVEAMRNPYSNVAYELRRVNFFLGQEVRYGDRYPDYVARLFKKDKLVNWTGEIHESSQVNGKIGRLDAPFYHLTHRNIRTMLEKTINFSEHEAALRFRANHPLVVWWRLLRVLVSEFYLRVIKYQGFRQGTEGWIDGLFQAFSLFVVYARLWELQRQPTLETTYEKLDEDILAGRL